MRLHKSQSSNKIWSATGFVWAFLAWFKSYLSFQGREIAREHAASSLFVFPVLSSGVSPRGLSVRCMLQHGGVSLACWFSSRYW